jgi:hypothetical protein
MSLRITQQSVTELARFGGRARRVGVGMVLAAATGLVACNNLLDVTNPASVPADALSDPTLIPTLTAAAMQTLQCGVMQYDAATGMLAGEYWSGNGFVDNHPWEWRGVVQIKQAPGSCNYGRGTTAMGYYTPLQQARFQLDDAFNRLNNFTDDQVANRADQMATMRAYAGYAYLLLGEGMCDMTVDGGPKITRDSSVSIAVTRFTDAIARATTAGDQSILNMALDGRARAFLDLNKLPEAAADAILVPSGFVRVAEFTDGGASNRENRFYNLTIRNNYLTVPPAYQNLTVNGVPGNIPDPRVTLVNTGKLSNDGVTPWWQQQKYVKQLAGSPIPIASWNEAQLIYAEAVGGQAGLDAINAVRTANGVPTLAGPPPTGQAYTDLILEERRRQLFSEGQRYGDMLRYNLPFQSGVNRKGQTYSDLTCTPLPDVETQNNPNLQ